MQSTPSLGMHSVHLVTKTILSVCTIAFTLSAVVVHLFDFMIADHVTLVLLLAAAICIWIAGEVPRGPVVLLLLVFIGLLGLHAREDLFSGFSQPSLLFLVAILFVGKTIEGVGTAQRVSQRLLTARASGPLGLLWQVPLFMLAIAAVISSATARTALLHPIVDRSLGQESSPGQAKYLTLFTSNIAPMTSRAFLSGGPGIIVAADLMAKAGHSLHWGEWILWMGVPVTLIVLISALGHWLWLRPGNWDVQTTADIDPWTPQDLSVGFVALGMVLLWTFGFIVGVDASSTAVLGMGVLALLLPQSHQVIKRVNWDLVVFAGGTLSLARILLDTGTARWISQGVFGPLHYVSHPLVSVILIFGGLVLLRVPLSNGLSYSAMVFPLILSLGDIGGVAALHIAFMALIAGAISFLPIQSNPMMISYASGRYGVKDTLISGGITFATALVVFEVAAIPYWTWLAHR